jgi:hypothetical protein
LFGGGGRDSLWPFMPLLFLGLYMMDFYSQFMELCKKGKTDYNGSTTTTKPLIPNKMGAHKNKFCFLCCITEINAPDMLAFLFAFVYDIGLLMILIVPKITLCLNEVGFHMVNVVVCFPYCLIDDPFVLKDRISSSEHMLVST